MTSDAGGVRSNVADAGFGVEPFTYSVVLDQSATPLAVPGTGNLNARVTAGQLTGSPNLLNIRNDDTGQVVASCNNEWNACGYAFATSWADNEATTTRHYSTYVTAPNGSVISNVATASFVVQPFRYSVVLDQGPATIVVPGSGNLNARNTTGQLVGSPNVLNIRNDDTNQVVASCNNEWNACGYAFATSWADNGESSTRHYSAYVTSPSGTVISNVDHAQFNVVPFQFDVTVRPDDSSVHVGQLTNIHAEITHGQMWGTPYSLKIRDNESDEVVASCYNWWNTCDFGFAPSFIENGDEHSHRFSAYMGSADDSQKPSNNAQTSVSVLPLRYNVEFVASQTVFSTPGTLNLYARITSGVLPGTPYAIIIRDEDAESDDSRNVLARCNNWNGDCVFNLGVSWDDLVKDGLRRFSASVGNDDGTFSNEVHVEIALNAPRFEVSLEFGDHSPSDPDDTLPAKAKSSPGVYGTPFSLQIRNDDGGVVASCAGNPGEECPAVLGDGKYYAAVVSPSGKIVSRSSYWFLEDGVASPTDINDIDLLALSRRYANPASVCAALLFAPGTHFQGGSVTDQYLSCLVEAPRKSSSLAMLKWLTTITGGVAVIRYIRDHYIGGDDGEGGTGSDEDGGGDTSEPGGGTGSPPSTEPVVVPSPPLDPGDSPDTPEITGLAQQLLIKNPVLAEMGILTPEKARIEVRGCAKLIARAGRPPSDCVQLPTFVVSWYDYPGPTSLERYAQRKWPVWIIPHVSYQGHPGEDRRWYSKMKWCNRAAREQDPGKGCHEFPYWSMREGGPNRFKTPFLRLTNMDDNRDEGGRYYRFHKYDCHLPEGAPFIYYPTPVPSPLPTMSLCNGG